MSERSRRSVGDALSTRSVCWLLGLSRVASGSQALLITTGRGADRRGVGVAPLRPGEERAAGNSHPDEVSPDSCTSATDAADPLSRARNLGAVHKTVARSVAT